MTLLLAAAALSLLFGSYVVIRAVIEADASLRHTNSFPPAQTEAPREQRRAA